MFELSSPVLEARYIQFQYGENIVLRNCNIELYEGECLAILGPSGSGKSTLLSLLAGRLPLNHAYYYQIAGQDMVAGESAKDLRHLTGYVSQNPAQTLDMNLSAGANIVRQLFDIGSRDAKLALAHCRHWMRRLGLDDSRLLEPVGQFSGGMQQRVQIAAALVHRPQVLFLDEPTTGLDTVSQSQLIDILRGLKHDRSTAMLFVTHDLSIARLIADRIIVMDKGEIVEEAVCDRLLTDPQSSAATELVRAML